MPCLLVAGTEDADVPSDMVIKFAADATTAATAALTTTATASAVTTEIESNIKRRLPVNLLLLSGVDHYDLVNTNNATKKDVWPTIFGTIVSMLPVYDE